MKRILAVILTLVIVFPLLNIYKVNAETSDVYKTVFKGDFTKFLSTRAYMDFWSISYTRHSHYAFIDINQDGTDELIVGEDPNSKEWANFQVFGYDKIKNEIKLIPIEDNLTGAVEMMSWTSCFRGLMYSADKAALVFARLNNGMKNRTEIYYSIEDGNLVEVGYKAFNVDENNEIEYFVDGEKVTYSEFNSTAKYPLDFKPIEEYLDSEFNENTKNNKRIKKIVEFNNDTKKRVYEFEYGESNELLSASNGGNTIVSITYDDSLRPNSIISSGNKYYYCYDDDDLDVAINGQSNVVRYDSDGKIKNVQTSTMMGYWKKLYEYSSDGTNLKIINEEYKDRSFETLISSREEKYTSQIAIASCNS